jgi:hypothetical protein
MYAELFQMSSENNCFYLPLAGEHILFSLIAVIFCYYKNHPNVSKIDLLFWLNLNQKEILKKSANE